MATDCVSYTQAQEKPLAPMLPIPLYLLTHLTRRSRGPVLPPAIHVSPLALLLQAMNSLQAEPVRELKAPASRDLHTAISDLSQLPPFMPLPVPKGKAPLHPHSLVPKPQVLAISFEGAHSMGLHFLDTIYSQSYQYFVSVK